MTVLLSALLFSSPSEVIVTFTVLSGSSLAESRQTEPKSVVVSLNATDVFAGIDTIYAGSMLADIVTSDFFGSAA